MESFNDLRIMLWDHEPALWHRLRGAGVFVTPPEVSALAATSGYYLSTLRVEELAD
jgi:hypothetical protein